MAGYTGGFSGGFDGGFQGGFDGGFKSSFGTQPKELTEAQAELLPILQELKTKEDEAPKKIRPVQWIFDRLSTGQYVTANALDAVLDNLDEDEPLEKQIIDVLGAMKRGITGEQRGNYADIIKEHSTGAFKEWTDKDLFSWNGQDKRDDNKFLGKSTVGDLLGLAGDIFLDPTTYIGAGLLGKAGKASKGAKAAASKFAEDSITVAAKKMAERIGAGKVDDLARIASSGIDAGTFAKKIAKNSDDAAKYLLKKSTGDLAHDMNRIYKEAYQQALKSTPEELTKIMQDSISSFQPHYEKVLDKAKGKVENLWGKTGGVATKKMQAKIDTATSKLSRLMENKPLEDLASKLDGRYLKAGQTYVAKLFGKELGVGIHKTGLVRSGVERIGDLITNNPAASGLEKAWWTITRNGPIGELRKIIGIRDPYQKLVRMKELQEGSQFFLRKTQENMQNVLKATGAFDDEVKAMYVAANDLAEKLNTKANPMDVFKLLNDPEQIAKLGINPDQLVQVKQLATNVTELTRSWRMEYQKVADKGYVEQMGFIENYLPSIMREHTGKKSKGFRKVGSSSQPGWAKKRSFSRAESLEMEKTKLRWLYKDMNMTEEQITKLAQDSNLTGYVMDLDEMLQSRAYAQAMVSKRENLIDTFREFGVPLDLIEKDKAVKRVLFHQNQQLPNLGISKIPEKGMEGYLFDSEVADVFGRINRATGTDLKKTREMFKKYTSWWKGIVTMTPGFHARNWLSNQMTGFVNHGAAWMNPALDRDATAAVVYAITRNHPNQVLEKIGMKLSDYNRLLTKTYGGETLKDLADRAIRDGLISEAQMGFSIKDSINSMGKKASGWIGSPEFIGRRASQEVGSVIENSSKFKSFLLNFDDVMKDVPAGKRANYIETAREAATMESKKWFIDYEDLTPFESEKMKDIIPFYSWLRHNIVNQVEGLIYHPDIYAMFPKAQEFLELEDPNYDPGLIPEWLQQTGAFPIAKEGDITKLFRPDLPYMDLNKIPLQFEQGSLFPKVNFQEAKDTLVNAAHPAIKWLASNATKKGYDFFKGKELDDFEDAPYALQLLIQNPETFAWLDGFMRQAGAEDGLKMKLEDNKIKIDAKMVQTLDTYAPFLRQFNYLLYTVTGKIPGVEEALEEATGIKDDYDKLEQSMQLMSYYSGLKNYPVNLGEEAFRKDKNRYYEARDIRTERRRALPGYEKRNYRDDTDALIRRLSDAVR